MFDHYKSDNQFTFFATKVDSAYTLDE